jgi:hypothetical protein
MNDPYIYLRENALPKPLCTEIISYFEQNKQLQRPGSTIGGIQKDVKDTSDIFINMEITNQPIEIINIINVLQDELKYHLSEYYNCINMIYKKETDKIYKKPLCTDGFLIQKYEKNIGKYHYHNDAYIANNRMRVLTFLFYLNNVDVGGETEFTGTYKIKPKQGSILLFPSTWTYHHRGNMPISESKYIITGWLSKDIKKE